MLACRRYLRNGYSVISFPRRPGDLRESLKRSTVVGRAFCVEGAWQFIGAAVGLGECICNRYVNIVVETVIEFLELATRDGCRGTGHAGFVSRELRLYVWL